MGYSNLKFGIHIPASSPDYLPSAEEYVRFFQKAEELGFHSLWTEDRLFHQSNFLDSLTLLSWAAASTKTIRIGTAVLLLALRNAPMLARQVSALHHLSKGRLTLGISLGGRPSEYKGLGVDMSKRVIRLRENIIVLRQLLAGNEVSYSGDYYELEEAIVRPGVEPIDAIPLYMGGGTARVLRRAAELSDGWINGPFNSPSEFRESWATVLEHARGFGRDPLSLEGSKLVFVAANQDRNRARSSLKSFVDGYFGPSFDVDKHGITGTPSEVADRLGEFADAGVTLFMMGVPDLDIRHLETLAHQVIPRLNG